MIQNFTNALLILLNHKYKCMIIVMSFLCVALVYIFFQFPLGTREDIHQVLNGLFQFSGIFSAILITFIISKVIQIRQEKLERKKEIIQLSNKVTDFRRIARIIKDSRDFWDSKQLDTFRKVNYKNINLFHIRIPKYEDSHKDLIRQLHAEKYKDGFYLYFDMKSLVLNHRNRWQLDLYDQYDHDKTYTIDILENWIMAHSGSYLWYCLENEYQDYKHCLFPQNIHQHDQKQILSLCKKINSDKYMNSHYNTDLLVSIGNDFTGYLLPKLYDLTSLNEQRLPKYVSLLIYLLYVTMITGVLLPLIMISLKVNFTLLLIISSLGVGVLGLSLVLFLLQFKNILENEIRIDK
jgi:hypothetical protein